MTHKLCQWEKQKIVLQVSAHFPFQNRKLYVSNNEKKERKKTRAACFFKSSRLKFQLLTPRLYSFWVSDQKHPCESVPTTQTAAVTRRNMQQFSHCERQMAAPVTSLLAHQMAFSFVLGDLHLWSAHFGVARWSSSYLSSYKVLGET